MNPKEALTQMVRGRNGAANMTVGEIMLRWQKGTLTSSDLEMHYGLSDQWLYNLTKKLEAFKAAEKLF